MRSKWDLVGILLILVAVNLSIVQKERALDHGRTVLLELAPVDPRSLMQGDYMTLRFALADQVPKDAADAGTVYVSLDENGVATRLSDSASPELVPLQYRRHEGRVVFDAESYFFQEGQGHFFESAKYGELKVDALGKPMLVGLLDKQRRPIKP